MRAGFGIDVLGAVGGVADQPLRLYAEQSSVRSASGIDISRVQLY